MNRNVSEKIKSFFSKFNHKKLKKGTILIDFGQQPEGVFYLVGGVVREYSISEQGEEMTLHMFSPGSFFPMTWAISKIPNRYRYEAWTPVEFYLAPKDKVVNFLLKEPEILKSLTSRLLDGLDKLSTRIELMTFKESKHKVMSILLFLARHFGKRKKGNVILTYRFTHKDIATLAGLTRETTSRELKKLEKGGLISCRDRLIVIKNAIKLRSLIKK